MRAWFVPQGTRIEALRATRDLGSYSEGDLERLLPYFDEVTLPAGCEVARKGDSCAEYVVVVRGRLQASGEGSSALVAGDSVGWDAMWERTRNEATVVVAKDAQLLVMSHSQFRAVKAVAYPPD
jgi:CRP-like cAMP-binding protein